MARYLLASSPIHGHVMPILAIARDLVERGHDVTVLTGERFADATRRTGAEHVALPGTVDFDDRDIDGSRPERRRKRGPAKLVWDVKHVFIDAAPDQYASVRRLVAEREIDAIVAEAAFTGLIPLLLGPRDERPPVVGVGVLPLMLSSRDTAPNGLGLPPVPGLRGRLRNRALTFLVQKVLFGSAQRHADRMLASLGRPALPTFVFDATRLADRFVQLTVPGFEYPRSDLPENVRFVGPVQPPARADLPLPSWWDELDGTRPVVHVTQGTIANDDLDRLVGPTLRALAGEDVLVVAATGGPPVSAVPGPIPANARVAEFIPYDRLLPKVDVMVTNGGYGGVQQALAQGIPLVVAGDGEDKPEVAARVAWSGAGINLRTGDPKAGQIGTAVARLRDEPAFRARARALAAEMASHDAFGQIAATLDELTEAEGLHLVK